MEFLPVIESLTIASSTFNRTSTSFHVVAPSLPGYAFSSALPVIFESCSEGRDAETDEADRDALQLGAARFCFSFVGGTPLDRRFG